MATSETATRLTEAHQASQTRIAGALAVLASRLWYTTITPEDLTGSAARWVELLLPRIIRANASSAQRARAYLGAFRTLELGDLDGFTPEPIELVPAEAVRASLWATGPAALQKRLEKVSGEDITPTLERALTREAMDLTSKEVAGSSVRHALNGGREQLYQGVKEDRRALGYVRVIAPDACFFCKMLASRGAIYHDDSFAQADVRFHGPGNAKTHDSCRCSLEAIYSRSQPLPGGADHYQTLWNDNIQGQFSGKRAILEWRRLIEGRNPASE